MAGFFDFSNPDYQRLSGMLAGMASGFGKAAMPSSLPIGLGSALGMGAEGAYQGTQAGQKASTDIQNSQMEQGGKALGLDQQLIIENLLRSAMGKPPVTAKDLQGGMRSPLFGFGGIPSAPAPVATPSLTGPVGSQDASGAPASPAPDTSSSSSAPAAGGQPSSQALKNALVNKLLIGVQPTDYQKAKMFAESLPPGPEKTEALRNAAKLAGIDITANQRAGESTSLYDPETGTYKEAMRNPNLSPDLDYDPTTKTAAPVAGALEGLSKVEAVKAGAKAGYEPMTVYDKAGNEYIVPKTALQNGATQPGQTGKTSDAPSSGAPSPYAQRVSQLESGGNAGASNDKSSASGGDQFLSGTWMDLAKRYLPSNMIQGKSPDDILALRKNPNVSAYLTDRYAAENAPKLQGTGIKNVGPSELYLAHHFGPEGAAAILKAPVNTPLEQLLPPQVVAANPDVKGATVGDVYANANHAMKGVQLGGGGNTPPSVPAPNTPVAHSATGIPTKLDDFLTQLGPNYQPPNRPDAPPGALMGEPGKGTEEIQKLDGDRLEQYSKEAAGGQKVLTNIQQLYQIMGSGLSTGNMTSAATHLANYAQQSGFGALVPKSFDPNNAAAFNKLATDLVFAQLKQIGGRPMVSEIEGLKQANPNTSLPPAANVEILNNLLADQRWRDSRADLARQYMARYGSLGDFDARFNENYPETDTLNRIAAAAQKAGWKLPSGGADGPNGKAKPPKQAEGPDPNVQKQITQASIEATAKKYGHTPEQVKQNLRAKGYQVP